MKRTARAFMLLACLGGLGGCMQTDKQTQPKHWPPQTKKPVPYQGPYGEPIGAGNNPAAGMSPGLTPAGFTAGNNPRAGTNLIQAGYLKQDGPGDCENCGPTGSNGGLGTATVGNGSAYGLRQASHGKPPYIPDYQKYGGTVPAPAGGPPGAVAAIGANPFQMHQRPINMRTSVNFAAPDQMRVSWYGPNGWSEQPLVTPGRYNFLQGGVYRLKLSSVPNRLEKVYYPTLEVVPAHEKTATYLAHSSVPVTFTDEDFEQVDSSNMLIKVIYLPDLHNQDLATVVGPNELVSTRLEPNVDPIVEAQRRGTILLIIRLGNIDLNTPNSPAMDAPAPHMMRGGPPMMGVPTQPMPNVMPPVKADIKIEQTPPMKTEIKIEQTPPIKSPDDKRPAELPILK